MGVKLAKKIFLLALGMTPALPAFPLEREGRNVVLVYVDALRPDHTGMGGYGRATTPHLDHWGKESFVFRNAISQAPWTLPSVASLLTSLYPGGHGIVNKYALLTGERSEAAALSPEAMTLAELFKRNGYATAAFTGGAGLSRDIGFGRGFDVYFDSIPFGGFDATLPRAWDWIEEHRTEKFFLLVHGYDAHGQFDLPEGFSVRFSTPPFRKPGPDIETRFLALREKTVSGQDAGASDDEKQLWIALYDEKVARADRKVGEFLDRLAASGGLLEKTVLVVVSDHGEQLFERGGVDHGTSLYDELIRAVLMIRVPGRPGRQVASQVQLIDLMPTLADLLKLKCPAKVRRQMRGVSLVRLMEGDEDSRDAYSETDYLWRTSKRALRSEEGWKLIFDLTTGRKELYDLNTDPAEKNDLFKKEPGVAFGLEEKLYRHMGR